MNATILSSFWTSPDADDEDDEVLEDEEFDEDFDADEDDEDADPDEEDEEETWQVSSLTS
jgi:hypothetical protein